MKEIDGGLDGSKRDEAPHEEEQSENGGQEEKQDSGESLTTADVELEGKNQGKSGEGGEDNKLEAVEDGGPECDGEALKKEKRAKLKEQEGQKNEGVPDAADATLNDANTKKQAKEADVAKDKSGDVGKKVKPKKKGGPPPSVSRPRPSARSIRAAARNDIIAKFQQGAPE